MIRRTENESREDRTGASQVCPVCRASHLWPMEGEGTDDSLELWHYCSRSLLSPSATNETL